MTIIKHFRRRCIVFSKNTFSKIKVATLSVLVPLFAGSCHFSREAVTFFVMQRFLETLKCPITQALPVYPVVANDGYIYESEAISKHFENSHKSPMTNLRMRGTLVPAGHVIRLLNLMVEEGVKDDDLDAWVIERPNRTEYREARIDFYENGKHVRTKHTDFGEIEFYEDDKLVRCEYECGAIEFYEEDKHVRTEYAPTHADHGEICFFDDDKLVRIEYASTHSKYDQIDFFEDGKRVRIEYEHLGIVFIEDGKHVRTEFPPTHANHGMVHILDYENNRQTMRFHYVAPHPKEGAIEFVENAQHVRTEYECDSKYGQIDFFENWKHVRSEFHAPHQKDGQIWFFEDGKHVRTEYAPTHPKHGEVLFLKNDEIVRTKHKRACTTMGDSSESKKRRSVR